MTPLPYTPGLQIEPGTYIADMTNATYHAHDSVSKSQLDLIERSPAHYAYAPPRQQTRAMAVGSAIHTALLEPDRFASEYMSLSETTDRRSAEYKAAVKQYGADNVLTAAESANVAGMQEAAMANDIAGKLLRAKGEIELSGFATDPVTGIAVRHRFDKLLVEHGVAVDIKKTRDARAWAFSKSVNEYRYHVQAAFYADQYQWITGEVLRAFWFVAIEEQAPNNVMCYKLDDDAIAIGREIYQKNLSAYARCIEENYWPGYEQEDNILSLPGWVLAQREAELEDGGIS